MFQSNQVKNSNAMELKGLQVSLKRLMNRLKITHLITNRHVSIKKFMKTMKINHRFDIWHMAKGTLTSFFISTSIFISSILLNPLGFFYRTINQLLSFKGEKLLIVRKILNFAGVNNSFFKHFFANFKR